MGAVIQKSGNLLVFKSNQGTLCDPMDCSLPGSSVHGIPQARILELVSISYSGDLPDPGIEPTSFASPALAGGGYHQPPGKPVFYVVHFYNFFKLIFTGVQLIYNVVLVSAIQLSESVVHIHKSTLFRFHSHTGHYRGLSRVLCAVEQVLIVIC